MINNAYGGNAVTEAPWDTSEATESQLTYIDQLLKRLAQHDWSPLDTTQASTVIDRLNSVRRTAGIDFSPMDGVDSGRRSGR